MSLLNFLDNFKKNRAALHIPRPEEAADESPAPSVAPEARAEAVKWAEDKDTLADVIEMFKTIEEAIGDLDQPIAISAKAMLANLPKALRGPAWTPEAFPDVSIELERANLLQQLRKGRVRYPLSDLSPNLPPGWVVEEPGAVVELQLHEVVRAVPPELLQAQSRLSNEMLEVAEMRDFFHAHKAKAPEAPAPAPEATAPVAPEAPVVKAVAVEVPAPVKVPVEAAYVAAPTEPPVPEAPAPVAPEAPVVEAVAVEAAAPSSAAPRRAPPRRPAPVAAWDGVERLRDAAAETVDINEAGVDQFTAIPGVGRQRAEIIVRYRQEHGPFKSLFDLVEVPGVGRRLFMRMTGLNPALTKRRDRHLVLQQLLGGTGTLPPGLSEIAAQTALQTDAVGAILSGADGIVLARSEGVERSEHYAALAPAICRRLKRYVRRLSARPSAPISLILPGAEPTVMLLAAGRFYLILLLKPHADLDAVYDRAEKILAEVDWLLSPRAILRAPAA